MKVNLLLDNPGGVRSGYLNIDPYAEPDDPRRQRASPAALDEVVCDAECSEFVAINVLDYYPIYDVNTVFDHWVKKLAHGGSLIVSVVDTEEVARLWVADCISPQDAAELLYGKQKRIWEVRKSPHTLASVAEMFRSRGLQIVEQRVRNAIVLVKGTRP